MFEKKYTFDDIALVPQYNNIESRTDPNLNTLLTKNIEMNIPLIPSNMDSVISIELAEIIINNGGIPIFHRFCNIEKQIDFCKKFKNKCFVSCGLNDSDKLDKLYDAGALGVCIDIAHGHSKKMIDLIKHLKKKFPNKEVIAGNICTIDGYKDLVNAGADAVKIGIGPGAACTTRIITGFGVPQFSAIYDIAKIARKLKVPIIADGGIRNSKDVILALAAGANSCMIGSLFNKTYESACDKFVIKDTNYIKIKTNDELKESLKNNQDIYSLYRGQASSHFQNDYYGGIKKGTVAEGTFFYNKCNNSTQDIIDKLCGGLRSGLTYGGSNNITELQRKAEFVEVTNNYIYESNPRKNN